MVIYKIKATPLYIIQSGIVGYPTGNNFGYQAANGRLWSSTTPSGTDAYNLYYPSNVVYPADSNNRRYGFPVRCITRDFNFLLVQYGIAVNYVESGNAGFGDNGYLNIQNNPICSTRSGYFAGGGFNYQASSGYLWSGTTYSGTSAYILGYNSGNVYPAYSDIRQSGFPVRCIAHFFLVLLISATY